MARRKESIILTGFSGTGKSVVGQEVARTLSWYFIDTDEQIVKQAGKPIAEIFRQDGEAKFRDLERHIIQRACQQRRMVIAVGGGAILDPHNYEVMVQSGFVACLEAKPETIYQRLFKESGHGRGGEVRPLLSGSNPLERIRQLKALRQPYYAQVDWTVHTDNLTISQVSEEVLRAWQMLDAEGEEEKSTQVFPLFGGQHDVACMVKTATQSYPIFVGWGLLDKLGEKIKESGLSGAVNVISDETVFSIYGGEIKKTLEHSGFAVNSFVVPPGERTKSTDFANRIYDFLVEHRAERNDIIMALGGGMVGDLAGFVAATFLRGMPWIQVPTSLVGMVDASIGGKVGVNHPQAKNLIGAFYQPNFVLVDCQALSSLSQRELTSGWAEVIKYGLILDAGFFKFLEGNAAKLMKLETDVLIQAVARSAALKAQVVSEDEKDQGKRIILNYGHTIAHGLEAATQYRQFLHGEAVAIGMGVSLVRH